MSEQKLEFKLESPDGLFSIEVYKIDSQYPFLTAITNFNTQQHQVFSRKLRRHPYVVVFDEMSSYRSDEKQGYVFKMDSSYSADVFMEDLATLMELYLYEDTETIAPGIRTTN